MVAIESHLLEMFLKAGQAPPRGDALLTMVKMVADLWREIPDDRLRGVVEKAIIKSAPFAASPAFVAKLWQDRNKDAQGYPIHDQVAAVRFQQAQRPPSEAHRIEDLGSRPIVDMPRADYLAQCVNLYKKAGLPVPDHLISN